MTIKASGPARPGFPQSPCNRTCTLNDDLICVGCKRSMDEIVGWSAMSADEQWEVISRLANRDAAIVLGSQ